VVPYNVPPDAANADAYDPYLNRVGRMLRRGKGAAEIAVYLGKVRTQAFRRDENETVDELFHNVDLDFDGFRHCPDSAT
jgi:hypothetical protein